MLCRIILDNSMCNYRLFGFFHYHHRSFGMDLRFTKTLQNDALTTQWVEWRDEISLAAAQGYSGSFGECNQSMWYNFTALTMTSLARFLFSLETWICFTCFFIHNNKPTLQVQHNSLSISTAKQLGWFQSAIFCFFATHRISRFARNFLPAWHIWSSRSEKNLKVGSWCCRNLSITIKKQNGQWPCMIFVGLILNTDVGRIFYIFLFDVQCVYSVYILCMQFTYSK